MIISQELKLETIGYFQQIYLNYVPLFKKAPVYFILQSPAIFQSVPFPSFCDLLRFALKGVLICIFSYFYQKWKLSLTADSDVTHKLLYAIFICTNTGKWHLSFDITACVLHLKSTKNTRDRIMLLLGLLIPVSTF